MDFKIAECPKCKRKHIVEYIVCGTPCCEVYLYEDTEDNRKDVTKELSESANAMSKDFDEFCVRLKNYETEWNRTHVFIPFKVVRIPNEALIKLTEVPL